MKTYELTNPYVMGSLNKKFQANSSLEAAKKALHYGSNKMTSKTYGFTDVEIQKIKRVYDYAIGEDSFDTEKYRKDFGIFIKENDKRKGTDFYKVFPELKEFYDKYKP